MLRSGAKAGDAIFVTGDLGGSLAGKHLEFEPRLAEARWLAEHFTIHAMIDLSDGLAGDLRHILKAGGVGAELLKPAIPVSRAAKARARLQNRRCLPRSPTARILNCCSRSPVGDAVKLLDAWKRKFPKLKLSCIGKIVAGGGILIRDKTGSHKLDSHGYVHFA